VSGRRRGVKAVVNVKDTVLEINTTVEVRVVRFLSKVLLGSASF
jgi:hypothetical protein